MIAIIPDTRDSEYEDECVCCALGDYDPIKDPADGVVGACYNCGHSPEEHENG